MTELPLIGDYSTPTTPLSGARIGVITFPGTLDDVDALRAVRLAEEPVLARPLGPVPAADLVEAAALESRAVSYTHLRAHEP